MSVSLVLLGAQRHRPTLIDAVRSCGVQGRIAAITAGWEEREDDDHDLHDHLGSIATNLHLHARAEKVFADDPKLYERLYQAYKQHRRLQELYRLRLDHAMQAVHALHRSKAERDLLDPQIEEAIEDIRRLDAAHLARIETLHAEKWDAIRPREHAALARHRDELQRELDGCAALCIAGGHIGILLNRLHLFDIPGIWDESRPLFAWSAGAMALGERVVLFHDSPPQGPGHAEVYQPGLGRARGVQPFPHVKHRLRLDDAKRISLLARRMSPLRCMALDEGRRIDFSPEGWTVHPGVRELLEDGSVQGVDAA